MGSTCTDGPAVTIPADGRRLGLRENRWQFFLYTLITLLVGMTIGVERVALPPLARHAFGITSVFWVLRHECGFRDEMIGCFSLRDKGFGSGEWPGDRYSFRGGLDCPGNSRSVSISHVTRTGGL